MNTQEINKATEEIISYFKDYDVILTNFDLQECADIMGIPIKHMHILLCNLEDKDTMIDISEGNFYFDIEDEGIFNDCYHDMMFDLGYEQENDD